MTKSLRSTVFGFFRRGANAPYNSCEEKDTSEKDTSNKRSLKCYTMFLLCIIVGCSLSSEELQISDGVRWVRYGIRESCIYASFCNREIEGDLHVEFLGKGVLVSKWIAISKSHEWSYIDIGNRKVIDFPTNECPEWIKALTQEKKIHQSYCLDTLLGENKIDSDYLSFVEERTSLKESLARQRGGCTK